MLFVAFENNYIIILTKNKLLIKKSSAKKTRLSPRSHNGPPFVMCGGRKPAVKRYFASSQSNNSTTELAEYSNFAYRFVVKPSAIERLIKSNTPL